MPQLLDTILSGSLSGPCAPEVELAVGGCDEASIRGAAASSSGR
jgi:hypothetical protein